MCSHRWYKIDLCSEQLVTLYELNGYTLFHQLTHSVLKVKNQSAQQQDGTAGWNTGL